MSDSTISVSYVDGQAKPTTAAWVTLAILCFVYALNFLDRQLLSILAKPIQDTLTSATVSVAGLAGYISPSSIV